MTHIYDPKTGLSRCSECGFIVYDVCLCGADGSPTDVEPSAASGERRAGSGPIREDD